MRNSVAANVDIQQRIGSRRQRTDEPGGRNLRQRVPAPVPAPVPDAVVAPVVAALHAPVPDAVVAPVVAALHAPGPDAALAPVVVAALHAPVLVPHPKPSAQMQRLVAALKVANDTKAEEAKEKDEIRKVVRAERQEDMNNLVEKLTKPLALKQRDETAKLSLNQLNHLSSYDTFAFLLDDSALTINDFKGVSLKYALKMFTTYGEVEFIEKIKSNSITESNASDLWDHLEALVEGV